jgi:tungstate transport system substrate-binding protein
MKKINLTARMALAAAAILLLLPAMITACGSDDPPLVLAATNDLDKSGLLQAWVEDFQSGKGARVELLIVPDEEAFAMARYGECDLILTHIPEAGAELEELGYLEGGQDIMSGDFVILGPPGDPAGIRDMDKALEAFKKIAETKKGFVLRYDGSGTAFREAYFLEAVGADTTGGWLLPTDADTEEALRQASREGAYTLADRSTYERLDGELDLEVLVQGDVLLEDTYRAAAVSVFTYPDTNLEGALEFIDYMLSEDARALLDPGAWSPAGE